MLYYVAKKGHGKFDDKLPLKLIKKLIWLNWTAVLKGGVKLLPAFSSAKHRILNLQRTSLSNFCSVLILFTVIISSQIKFTNPRETMVAL